MLKIIWKQIINRKKNNVWVVLELLLIFCLVWYMVDYFFVLGYNKSIPMHHDLKNTYMLNLSTLPPKHAAYQEEESVPAKEFEHFRRVIERLKEHPEVESIALAFDRYSMPGLGRFYKTEFRNAADTTKNMIAHLVYFFPGEDYLATFRYTKNNGQTPISAFDYSWDNPSSFLISDMMQKTLFPGEAAVGQPFEETQPRPNFPRSQYRTIEVVDDIKRLDHLRPIAQMLIPMQLNEKNYKRFYIAFRTKSNMQPQSFTQTFRKEMSGRLRIGNYYLGSIDSLELIREDSNYKTGIPNNIRIRVILMIFLFANICLCVLGTFWHRVNLRREEIGIRRAMGANTAGIKQLFSIEGLLLLTIAMLPALLIEIHVIHAGLIETMGQSIESYGDYLPDHSVVRFLITNALTWLLMAGMVLTGIWYPARSASRINPVEALQDE